MTLCALLAVACAEEPTTTDDEGGNEPGEVSLELATGASALCLDGPDEIRIAARRVNCWDPELPCTVPQDPPWVFGTAMPCAEIEGIRDWRLQLSQTGEWTGGALVDALCLTREGLHPVRIANEDLDAAAQIEVGLDLGTGCAP